MGYSTLGALAIHRNLFRPAANQRELGCTRESESRKEAPEIEEIVVEVAPIEESKLKANESKQFI